MSGDITIVTGPRGGGKTTLCREVAAAARGAGRDVAGVLCPAVFAGPDKVGIEVVDLRTGETRALARLRGPGEPAPPARGRWAFDEAALAWGDALLRRATPCDLLVVDELGPLEFEHGQGWGAGLVALDSAAFGAALVVVRPGLLERARRRWPGAAVADATSPRDRRALVARLAPDGGDGAEWMIELEDLSVRYGERPALEGVSLRVAAGESVLVAGPSGCGKSTLARLLAGLVPGVFPAGVEGRARVAGLDPTRAPRGGLAARVGLVFQNPATQLFCLTVEEEAAFGPRNLGLGEDETRERVEWALRATGLAGLRDRAPLELSGGEQQRLAIAAALALRPPLLVLDEPLASLDRSGARQVLETLAELNRRHGVTVMTIEHRLAEAARHAGRMVLLEAGRVVADGPAAEVTADAARLRALGLARPPAVAARPGPAPPAHGAALVELRGVSAGYGGRAVLDGVDLRLYPGEFVALVGENGSGKSTLARVLAGLMRPRRGRRLAGDGAARPGLGVGLLCQNPLDQLLTERVDDEVALGPRNWAVFDPAAHERTLAAADLQALRPRAPLSLSAGQQQRTALAATLAMAPRLLILDEPTLGQDWAHLERLMDLVADLNSRGSAVLLITHDRDLASRYARRTLLLRGGRLAADGAPAEDGS